MPLIWGVTRVVPFIKESAEHDKEQLLIFEFMTAYNDLRKACSKGDLRIHLSVEGNRHDVGANTAARIEEDQ